MMNGTIASLIHLAYPSDVRELIGAPDWIASELYDVHAKAQGDPSRDVMIAMLRGLLKDRLKLATHYDTSERPVYALVIARSDGRLGPDIERSSIDCEANVARSRAGLRVESEPCGMRVAPGMRAYRGVTMEELGRSITITAGRVIVDRTGLAGRFDATLRTPPRTSQGPPDPGALFTALQEQLGLKLQPDRAPVRFLVIDRVERPSEE